ncbi:MAG: septum site-determining protein MinC, partial [Candidatus Desulforudis sp.]|nr:septum site-determining protein MinC [Bacillota bacterium]MBV1769017.1 septum site-determining protein MinC [Desulforudis sp.]
GAKVEAEGSVLVFGRCRGTVMAGTNGNRKARVVCHSFHGTLVAIADIIGYPEAPSEPNQFIAASLQGDQIVVNPA